MHRHNQYCPSSLFHLSSLCLLSLLANNCQGEGTDDRTGTTEASGSVVFRTTPLSNDPISAACYTVRAYDGDGAPLWEAADACSGPTGGFGGFSGSLEYVGFCDAEKPTTTLTLELNSISDDTGTVIDPQAYENPCPVGSSDCSVQVDCVANEDVHAFLPITVLKNGDKGFVDVEVEIDSITCSAKLDCFPASQPGFNLDDSEGNPLDTVVVALSCETDTCSDNHLYLNDLVMACDQDGDGSRETVINIDPSSPGATDPATIAAPVVRAAVYSGESVDEHTRYANVAFGVATDTALDCQVSTKATLSQLPLPLQSTPADAVYPHIDWQVTITDTAGQLICSEHPLNVADSGVTILFTGLDADPPITFAHELAETCAGTGPGGSPDHKIVFETSDSYTGDFGGLAVADATCQGIADAAGLQGTYLAWLSDDQASPSTRFTQANVPYQLVDGQVIALNYADLVDGSIATHIDTDEFGNFVGGENSVWTATNSDGSPVGTNCGNWTVLAFNGHRGVHTATDSGWSTHSNIACTIPAHLYCFEQ